MAEKKNITIKIKDMNNKFRKGKYVYIKERGKNASYYKYIQGTSIDDYIYLYHSKSKSKKLGIRVISEKSDTEKYLIKKNIKKTKIDSLITKGITNVQVDNIGKLDVKSVHGSYVKMLSPLVHDKELLQVLALPENIKKIKHRIQMDIFVKDLSEENVLHIWCANKTIDEVREDVRFFYGKTNISEERIQKFLNKGYQLRADTKGIEVKGSPPSFVIKNKIEKIMFKLKFVKAK